MLKIKPFKLEWYLLTVISTSFFIFSINDRVNAVPLDSILNQLIEKVLGVNLNSADEGNNAGPYPSSSPGGMVLQDQVPSYSNSPQTQPSYYPQSPPQQPYSPAPYQQSMPTQPLIYSPVFMIPPQVNNFNNH